MVCPFKLSRRNIEAQYLAITIDVFVHECFMEFVQCKPACLDFIHVNTIGVMHYDSVRIC